MIEGMGPRPRASTVLPLGPYFSLPGSSGYKGNLGADADQQNPTKPPKIEQICKFELDRFGSRRTECRHRRGIAPEPLPSGRGFYFAFAFVFFFWPPRLVIRSAFSS